MPLTDKGDHMRRTIAGGFVAAAAFLGASGLVTGAAWAEEPGHGSCNRGTQHAHGTVPHETEGNHVAHSRIPHCEGH